MIDAVCEVAFWTIATVVGVPAGIIIGSLLFAGIVLLLGGIWAAISAVIR